MGFSQSNAAVNKQRVVNKTWFFRNNNRRRMGQLIKRSDHKRIKSIPGIKISCPMRQRLLFLKNQVLFTTLCLFTAALDWEKPIFCRPLATKPTNHLKKRG